jgi:hypothetical protein
MAYLPNTAHSPAGSPLAAGGAGARTRGVWLKFPPAWT